MFAIQMVTVWLCRLRGHLWISHYEASEVPPYERHAAHEPYCRRCGAPNPTWHMAHARSQQEPKDWEDNQHG